jgi:hypothetical protein
MLALIVILAVIGYGAFHHHHYRRRRRGGFGVWESMRGPFGTRIRISKRF